MKNRSILLLPSYFKWIGIVLIVIGLAGFYLYFVGGKPDFFKAKVFAVYTSYLKTRYFVVAQTNLLDEIGAVFSIIGLLFISFSKEKNETKLTERLRIRSLFIAIYLTVVVWVIMFSFVFGWPIFILSTFIFALFFILFFIIFQVLLFNSKNN